MKRNSVFIKSKLVLFSVLNVFGFTLAGPLQVTDAHASCDTTAGTGIDWQDCRKRNLIMTDTDFSQSNFSRTDFASSDLRNVILDKSDLTKSVLVRASLEGAHAHDANFSGVIAYRTKFGSGDYSGSNFDKAEVIRADFSNAILKNTSMAKGEFSRVAFSGATLGDVNLDYSNLARSDLRESKIVGPLSMSGTFLFRTRLEGVDLSSVTGLASWQLEMACGNSDTKLPEGIQAPSTWPCDEED